MPFNNSESIPKVGHGEYTVHYDSSNHLRVIFQRHGSIWKHVIGHCLANVVNCIVVWWLKHSHIIDLSMTDKGHSFMTLFVAFLIVSRVSMSLARYNEARNYLSIMYAESRELIQNTVVFTRHIQTTKAKEWRNDIAYKTCLLLRLAMAVIDYDSDHLPPWKIPELNNTNPNGTTSKNQEDGVTIRKQLLQGLLIDDSYNTTSTFPDATTTKTPMSPRRWGHHTRSAVPKQQQQPHRSVAVRSEREEGLRAPILMGYILRKAIYAAKIDHQIDELESWHYGKLFGSVDSFMRAYYGERKFLTTPFPFPLVQMARTFLFLWVYTLPWALQSDASSLVAHCAATFFITYGFVGLETVSIQLDDPFGHDENDFDNLGMAYTAFEDTYATIYDCDGAEWTDQLRYRMRGYTDSDETIVPSERSWLLASANQNGGP